MIIQLLLLTATTLAAPPSVEALEAERDRLVDQGRQLYEAAERVADHDAACMADEKKGRDIFLGYANTYIAAAWRQKKVSDTIACQKSVLSYFACQEALSCEEFLANTRDEAKYCNPGLIQVKAQCKG
jgi:hypothetical protein